MPRWKKLFNWPHLLWLLLFVVVGGGLLAAIAAEQRRRTPFWHKYEQVRQDMTRQEVEKILGPPTDEADWGGGLAPIGLSWVEGEQQINAYFIPLPSRERGASREVVTHKEFVPKSLWEKVRDKVRGAD